MILAAVPACKARKAPVTAPSASASSARATKPPLATDAALLSELSAITQTCKVDPAAGAISCQKGELRNLIANFSSNQRPKVTAIPTFTAALESERLEMRAVAANALQSVFRNLWGLDAKPGAVASGDAQRFLDATVALPAAQLRQALPAAVHASMLAGQADYLYATLEKSVAPELKPIAYRNLMTYGRLKAFEKVKALAMNKDSSVATAALDAPRNMRAWTEAEVQAICPWAGGFLNDPRSAVVSKAAALLTPCGGEHVDKLLDWAEQSLKSKTLFTARVSAFRDLCLPASQLGGRKPADAQCARSRKLLERAVDEQSLDAATRGMALVALAYQWPDDRTRTLAKRHEQSTQKVLAEHASRVVQRLTQIKRADSVQPAPAAPAEPRRAAAPPAGGAARQQAAATVPAAAVPTAEAPATPAAPTEAAAPAPPVETE